MNKKIITFAIAALGFCGISASAQAPADGKTCSKANTEQQIDNKMYKPQKFTDFAFEGILLDVNQQAQIDKINQQYQHQLGIRGQRGQKCDSTKCTKPECTADKKADRPCKDNNKSWRRDYAAQVKQVLTPDQYVTFLENIAFYTPERPAMAQGPQNKKIDQGGRHRHHAGVDRKHDGHRHGQQELKANGSAQQSM